MLRIPRLPSTPWGRKHRIPNSPALAAQPLSLAPSNCYPQRSLADLPFMFPQSPRRHLGKLQSFVDGLAGWPATVTAPQLMEVA